MCYALNMGCADGLFHHSLEGIDSFHHSHLQLLLSPWLETISGDEHTLYAVNGCLARIYAVEWHNWHHEGYKTVIKLFFIKYVPNTIRQQLYLKIIIQPCTLVATNSLMVQKLNSLLLSHIDATCASWLTIYISLKQCWRPSFLKVRFVDMYLARIYIHYRWFYRLFWSH